MVYDKSSKKLPPNRKGQKRAPRNPMKSKHLPTQIWYGKFLKKLRITRNLHGFTQVELGQKLDMQDSRISERETGKRPYSWEEVVRLAEIYEVSPAQLMSVEGEDVEIIETGKASLTARVEVKAIIWRDRVEMIERDEKDKKYVNCPKEVAVPGAYAAEVRGGAIPFGGYNHVVANPNRKPEIGNLVIARLESGEHVFKSWQPRGEAVILESPGGQDAHRELQRAEIKKVDVVTCLLLV